MSSFNLWQNVEQYTTSEEIEYDGVEVYSDDDILIGSAPENAVLEYPMIVRFPWNMPINGTNEGQIVANTIWGRIGGLSYAPYKAQNAISHPAVELGEAIILDSVHRVIARQNITADLLYTSDIEAPQKSETDPEYDFEGGVYTQDDIKKVIKQVSKASANLAIDVDKIEASITDIDGVLETSLTIDEHGFVFRNDGSDVTIAKGSIALSGAIVWDDLTSDCKARVDSGKGDANPDYIKSTYIDQAKVISGTIIGGAVYSTGLGQYSGQTAAYYVSDGVTGSGGSTVPNDPLGVLCYDAGGDTSVGDAQHRVILKTFSKTEGGSDKPVALKLQAGNAYDGWANMSLEANYVYVACPFVLDSWSFGTILPTAQDAPRYGQLFFLVQSTS